MPQWIIDSPQDVAAVERITIILGVLIVLAVSVIVLVIVRSRTHVKAGPLEFNEDDPADVADAIQATPDNVDASLADSDIPCAPYYTEHSRILEELQKGSAAMEANIEILTTIARQNSDMIEGINRMQEAEIQTLDVLLSRAEGIDSPELIRQARINLARAQGFKDRRREAE